MTPVRANEMQYVHVTASDDSAINWHGTFASYGGSSAESSATVPFWIAPGGHLGWHTDSPEETQYIISGQGELRTDDGAFPVGPGDVFVLPANVGHDLFNTGPEPLRAVAFFSDPVVVQTFDNVMLPPNSHILKSPNAPD